jgi:hypothetical protein
MGVGVIGGLLDMVERAKQSDEFQENQAVEIPECMNYDEAMVRLAHGKKLRIRSWKAIRYIRLYNPYSDEGFKITETEKADGTWSDFIIQKTKENKLKPWISKTDDYFADNWVVVSD